MAAGLERSASDAPRASVKRVSTEIGQTAPRVETLTVVNGFVTLTLDSTPLFIESQ